MTGRGRRGRGVRQLEVPDDVAREIEAHIALRAEELVGEGWEPAAAQEEAARLFGDRARVSAACEEIATRHERAVGRSRMLEAIWHDVRFSVRTLLKSPSFTAVAISTLALGIGANTAVFTVVNSVLLTPLPYEHPEEIVSVLERGSRGGGMSVAWVNFLDWKEDSRSFSSLAAYNAGTTTVLGGAEPIQTQVANVTEDFWSVFAVAAVEGRLTLPDDHVPGAAPVVVVSQSFWRNQLAERPLDEVRLEIGSARATVVGVVEGLFFPAGTDVWTAITPDGQSMSRTAHNYRTVARLAPGTTPAQARQEIDDLTVRIVEREVDADPDFLASGALLVSLQDELVDDARGTLWLLLGGAGLVLLVACTNLASTLLARGTTRARELAVRLSLGASKGRVVRQLLTESLVLSLAGAASGVVLAAVAMNAIREGGRALLPSIESAQINGWVLFYAAATAVLTALVFGLLPALRLTGRGAGEALRQGSRGSSVEARSPVWKALVGTEVALAVVLLVASGLLGRSFQRLVNEDLGIDGSDVMTMPVSLSLLEYDTPEAHARFYDEALAELSALPDVAEAGVVSTLPLGGMLPNGRLELDGDLEKRAVANYVVVSGSAFEALDVPLLQGRFFDERDVPEVEHVVIVSRSFAEEFWPGLDPLGRQVTGGGMDNFWEARTFARVVGVVGDVRYRNLGAEDGPTVYFPHSQRPFRLQYSATLVVEASLGDADALTGPIRTTIQSLEPDVPIRARSQSMVMADFTAPRRFVLLLFAGFSALGLLLAAIGIYGVVSYSVARRTREMGIRVALGAEPRAVISLVVNGAMRMVAGGLLVGLVAALFLSRLLENLLHEVSPTDPLTLGAVVALLGTIAFVASWLPARAGTRVDPISTIRAE